jgi:hypothetical protein
MKVRRLFLVLGIAVLISFTAHAEEEMGIISGKAQLPSGEPMSGALVYVFGEQKTVTEQVRARVPTFKAWQLDNDGRFTVKVPAGEYTLAIIKRRSGEKIWGPPESGDMYYFHKNDADQGMAKISVRSGETSDLGVLTAEVEEPILPETDFIAEIKGTLRDKDGQPVKWADVIAQPRPDQERIPPSSRSTTRSAKDGSFTIKIYHEGIYYIKAQTASLKSLGKNGGPPWVADTEILRGRYDMDQEPLIVKNGDVITGIEIKMMLNESR